VAGTQRQPAAASRPESRNAAEHTDPRVRTSSGWTRARIRGLKRLLAVVRPAFAQVHDIIIGVVCDSSQVGIANKEQLLQWHWLREASTAEHCLDVQAPRPC